MNVRLRSDNDGVVLSPLPEAAGYVVVVAVGWSHICSWYVSPIKR